MRNKFGAIVGGLVVVVGVWFLFSNDMWTLMICSEKLNDAECFGNSYVIPGFDSKKECMLEGATRFYREGFECGKNCEEIGNGLRMCKEICNSAGCYE